jgi:hypothetical protein
LYKNEGESVKKTKRKREGTQYIKRRERQREMTRERERERERE